MTTTKTILTLILFSLTFSTPAHAELSKEEERCATYATVVINYALLKKAYLSLRLRFFLFYAESGLSAQSVGDFDKIYPEPDFPDQQEYKKALALLEDLCSGLEE